MDPRLGESHEHTVTEALSAPQWQLASKIEDRNVAEWFDHTGSRHLVLCADAETAVPVSVFSGVCADTIKRVRSSSQDYRVIMYFCGLHQNQDASGPYVLMQNLVAQLLDEEEATVSFQTPSGLEGLGPFDLPRLVRLFTQLVKSLPKRTRLFCIIDDIAWFQNDEWGREMQLVTNTLYYLARNGYLEAELKVLVTEIRCPPRLSIPNAGQGDEDYVSAYAEQEESSVKPELLPEETGSYDIIEHDSDIL